MARGASRVEKPNLRDKTSARVTRAVQEVQVEADKALATVSKETKEVAKSFEQTQLYGTVTKYTKELKATSTHLAATTQHELSSAWRIVALTVWAELLFVLLTHTHYHQKYKLGPFKWAAPFLSSDAYSLTLPNATVWVRAAFLKPFAGWVVFSVIVPLALSQFIVFPRSEPRTRRRKHSLEPASPVTFSIMRLAALRVSPYLFASDWRFVSNFPDVQMLAASLALAFSIYEAVAI